MGWKNSSGEIQNISALVGVLSQRSSLPHRFLKKHSISFFPPEQIQRGREKKFVSELLLSTSRNEREPVC